ncbi:aspartate carbamoyltransferase [Compostibacillus humi]|jgi:aspartate carbamoyltransferase catalytic subunit|uniref:Aspartate carbamoyltransferase n=1 Tax=Compostibacillus humi TaxID=1245525 RepID=A0A8J2ZRL3_9BACI|nr:aspartate carbamoyltransferase catalytic subunit [Compostibacillus humi]GGH73512.1 aspartate carbamoyltransferase [Compostibacillus humi]
MKHFISVDSLSKEEIFRLLHQAQKLQKNPERMKEKFFVSNLFFEPSTRTKMSFIIAQKKLGLDIVEFHPDSSSLLKGETLYDTAKTLEAIGVQLLVIRHQADNWFSDLQQLNIPVINAGAGKAEHPTQCMSDLLTIYQEFGSFQGLNIVIAGDIKHSRVAHSNAKALTRLGAQVYFSAAPEFRAEELDIPYVSMDEAVEIADVLMLLRVQHERHMNKMETSNYLNRFGLTKEREKKMKEKAIIMHPAPVNRGVEIDSDLVECGRSRIFKQMENGVGIRMAIMLTILEEWGKKDENINYERKNFAAI